jgi:hypothetical protein
MRSLPRPLISVTRTGLPTLLAVAVLLTVPAAARAQIAVLGSTLDEHTAVPGQRHTGTIIVRNLTGKPQPARIYQTDYSFSADGTSHFDSAGTTARSNARWVTMSASSITVAPNTDVELSYTVTVPPIDSLRGTYWSTIMVEGAESAPPATGTRQVGLGAKIRYAIQVATQLPTTGTRRGRIAKLAFATDSSGARVLDIAVTNAGERAYHPILWVELYDKTGAIRSRSQQQRGLLYPGTSLKQRFRFGRLPAGEYKAVVFADTGDDTVSAAQYKLLF